MDTHSQDTYDLPQWQKDALDAELEAIEANPDYLVKWEDFKKQFLT